MTHRPLVRVRAARDFLLNGLRVPAGAPLLVEQHVAERLLLAGDVERDQAEVQPWPGRLPVLDRRVYRLR